MLCLTRPTPAAWVDSALKNLDAVLVDHAHCELKAAQNALSLVPRALSRAMADELLALADEEMRHVRRVLDELDRRGLRLGTPPPDPYAAELRTLANRSRPGGRDARQALLDRLLVAALIEARSCERFRLLADGLAGAGQAALAAFYEELFEAEARHYRVFTELAAEAAGDRALARQRLGQLSLAEGEVCAKLGAAAAIHG
ncbi:MAG TPA: tRNA isopentenyl-2-thiomethyl-A-37 hydroxylase MiaE [Polyangiaceae bacterium]|nr:tRNA isopentenyl-2-thiomethyl-A-37 hydroxylase MiaE [Polyangiaceae bacterium]